MKERLPVAGIGQALRAARRQDLFRREDTALILYDLEFLEERIRRLSAAFPPTALHGLAVKANPLASVMRMARLASPNIGVEAASTGEVFLALRAGYRPDQVVFDSPVKTTEDLTYALSEGVRLNLDNFDEMRRVKALFEASGGTLRPASAGIRINPQVGTGSIAESSVAGQYSKFGVPIGSSRDELVRTFLDNPWLDGVHLHVGSQGCPMEMLTNGIGILYDFALEVNALRRDAGMAPISVFDIGGGLPVSYRSDREPPAMEDYVAAIRKRAPGLFDPEAFKVITEFGRWTYTNSGWTVSRVEYVKRHPGINTAMLHVGADLFVRECLNPRDWSHEYLLFDEAGNRRTGDDDVPWNLAGPLCFAGDILARDLALPAVTEGDQLVVCDTGSYTFSMWSRYNSRLTPRILGYRGDRFEILRERETPEAMAAFWE